MGKTHEAQYTGIGDDDTEESMAISPLMKKRKRQLVKCHTTKGLFHGRMSFLQNISTCKFLVEELI